MYLLDTNVVSGLRRPRPHGAVIAWLRGVPDSDIHLSAVTIGELQAGIEITREQDSAKAAEIEAWVERVAETYNVLPMDARTFRRWARLMHRRSDALIEDAMIAATADVYNLTVVTRNVRDFEQFCVRTLDPILRKSGRQGTGTPCPRLESGSNRYREGAMRHHSRMIFAAMTAAAVLGLAGSSTADERDAPPNHLRVAQAGTVQGTTGVAPPTVVGNQNVQSVLGRQVLGSTGEDMGRVIDIVVDRNGQVRAAVIDFGGFLGVGSRKIAVDWAALRFAPTGSKSDRITLDLTRDQVKAARNTRTAGP